ncbi:uncharacterized protein LOC141618079 [Silene latifolia]|uniref:uncharacterized protein LOC141618079 n=1 Tax=Silene latifolia TaxID=37657 RepID=UPI003D77AAE1
MIKLGFWNVRGLNREEKQKFVNSFLHKNKVAVFGLLETKIKASNKNKTMYRVFQDWSLTSNNNKHPEGRIIVLWKPHWVDIHILEYDAQYIHMCVLDKIGNKQFHYTIVYAYNGISERESLWMSSAESDPFQDCLDTCHLIDSQAQGAFYTWNNKQEPESRIYSRLDRFLINCEWTDTFPHLCANFLPKGTYDHIPFIVDGGHQDGQSNRPFKYFNMWSISPLFQSIVAQVWGQRIKGTRMFKLVTRLKRLKPKFKELNRSHFSDIENAAEQAMTSLTHIQNQLQACPGDLTLLQLEYETNKKVSQTQKANMEYLRQKAKAHWITEGGLNSSYFYGVIKARRQQNAIHEIKDSKVVLHISKLGIQQAFLEYYQSLLGSQSDVTPVNVHIVRRGKVCDVSQGHRLLDPVTKEEIKNIFH